MNKLILLIALLAPPITDAIVDYQIPVPTGVSVGVGPATGNGKHQEDALGSSTLTPESIELLARLEWHK